MQPFIQGFDPVEHAAHSTPRRLSNREPQAHPLDNGRFDQLAVDHDEPVGCGLKCGDDLLCAGDFLNAWGEGGVDRRQVARVDGGFSG